MTLLKLAFLTSPIGLIVLAVVGLIAVIVLIATKTTWFQQAWSAAWGLIQGAASAAFNWVKSNWPLVLAILTGPIGLAVLAITKNWDKIQGGAQKLKDGLVSIMSGVADVLTAPWRIAIDGVKSLWNATLGGKGFSAPGWVPGIGGKGFTIPMLAGGGTASAGMAHIVGERGPELFVPGRTGTVVPNGALGGEQTLHLTLDLGEGIEQVVRIKLDRRNRRMNAAVAAGARRAFA